MTDEADDHVSVTRRHDLIEVQVPPGATNSDFTEFPDQWVRRWPAEEVWFARRDSAATAVR